MIGSYFFVAVQLQFSISPSSENSALISFRIDWFYLLAVQGRDSQESSPAQQFEIINSSPLSLPYEPTVTPVHDYQKNNSFDYMGFCWSSDVSAFSYAVQVCHSFLFKKQMYFHFMATVSVSSHFGTQEKKICHYFQFSPFNLSWSDGLILVFVYWVLCQLFHFPL